jgi:hypothetical protein
MNKTPKADALVNFTVRLPQSQIRRAKLVSVLQGIPLQGIVSIALTDYIANAEKTDPGLRGATLAAVRAHVAEGDFSKLPRAEQRRVRAEVQRRAKDEDPAIVGSADAAAAKRFRASGRKA